MATVSQQNDWETASCVYRGEGNAHLALSIQENKILLIKKLSSNKQDEDEEKWNNSIEFYNTVMYSLLNPFVSKVEKVLMTKNNIQQIEIDISPLRPSFRQRKELSLYAAIMQDYTNLEVKTKNHQSFPTFSFEIKPKCAIDIDNKCKFCFKQSAKLQAGRIHHKTNYCPKKLYSTDTNEMQEAIFSLLENPQNNLQIYKNSELIYSDAKHLQELEKFLAFWNMENPLSNIANLLVEILRFKFKTKTSPYRCETHKNMDTFTVLERIKQLQKLDNSNKAPESDEVGYVQHLLKMFSFTKNGALMDGSGDQLICTECTLNLKMFSPLCRHYLSKIARDCSIMIAVKQVPEISGEEDELNFVCVDEKYYLFDVKVFDLFPKDEI